MKWESKSKFSVYTFTIDVDKLVEPVYHLVLDVVKGNYGDRPFHEWAGDVFDLKAITGSEALGEDMTADIFVEVIARYLKQYLYSQMAKLKGSPIQLMYAPKCLMVAPSKQKVVPLLVNWIKKTEMMKEFLNLVHHSSIDNSKERLVQLLNDQYFGPAVIAKETCLLKATLISQNAVNGCAVIPVDSNSVWLCDALCSRIGVTADTQFSEVTFPDIEGASLSTGEILIPLSSIDQHVKTDNWQEYYWAMLNDVYSYRKGDVSIYRDRCTDFKTAMKEPAFALLMSRLQYNLYIRKDGQDIPEAYSSFFEEVYNIEEFIDKSNQILFTGKHNEEQLQQKPTLIGIYQTEKTDTEYNLHAWINADTADRQTLTKSSNSSSLNIKTVYALKPHYSYYFSSKYFEDLFQELLKEAGIETLHDVELSQSENPGESYLEVDNFVKKADGTIVLIETKTTLNKYNIEDTVAKVVKYQQMMKSSYSAVRTEYLLVAPYQNENVEEAYSFFTNAEGCTLNDFYLPIARFNGVKLHCIIDPNYGSLKAKMEQLLK